jgi:DNA-binding transcriptional LysR family regulator
MAGLSPTKIRRKTPKVHLLYPGGAHPPPKLRAFVDFAVPRLRRQLEQIAMALSA